MELPTPPKGKIFFCYELPYFRNRLPLNLSKSIILYFEVITGRKIC